MSETQSAAPAAESVSVEQALDQATSLPEGENEVEATEESSESEAPKPVKEAKQAAVIQDKKDAGQKLSKSEEKQLKEFKLKVNGKERSLKLDLSNEAEVQKYLQKAMASDEAFQQASLVQKAAQSFLNDLKSNPRKVLTDPNIGIDINKFAEDIMNDRIKEMEKSPEQREREKLENELKRIKEERDSEKKASDEREFQRTQMEHERQLETEISAALDIGGLPKTPRTVASMAEMMGIALRYGIELSPKDVAPIVKQMRADEFQEVLDSLADDQIEDFIGKKVMGRLRKKNVAKVKAPQSVNSVKSTGTIQKKEEAPAKKITLRDWLRV